MPHKNQEKNEPLYPVADCAISAIFNSGAGLFRYNPPEVNKMAHHTEELRINPDSQSTLLLGAHHWAAEDASGVHSALTVKTGGAHIQTNVTEQELRELASMLTHAANELKAAHARFDTMRAEYGLDK